jgi:hypothetical protein
MEMLTGRPVFEGETVSHVLASVLKSEPDWTTLPATTPASVRKLLRRCLEKDRKRRLDSAAAAGLEIDEASAAPEPRATSALPQRSRTRVTVAWSAAMLAIVGLVGALTEIALSLRSRSDNLASQFVVAAPEGTRLTNPFNSLAVSPDGSKLVFAAAASGVSRLWIRPFDSLTARPLAGTEEGTGPFWSPDSRFLGFFARGKLRMIDAAGGPVQPLADVTTVGMGRELSGTWGPDGAIVFTPTTAGNLFLVRIGRGGTAAPITRLDESRHEVRHLFPAFLPDGRHFLFVARSIPEANSTINVGELGSSQTRPIRPAVLASPVVYAPPGYLIFRQASALMAQAFDTTRWSVKGDPVPIAEQVDYGPIGFSVSKSGTLVYAFAIAAKSELVWVDRTGKTITAIAPPAIYNNIALSRDEKQLAFDRPGTKPI